MVETIQYTVTIPDLDNCKEYIDKVAENLIDQAEISARTDAMIAKREADELQARIDDTVARYATSEQVDIEEAIEIEKAALEQAERDIEEAEEALNIPEGKKLSGAVAEGKKKRAYNRSKSVEVAKQVNGNG